MSAKCRQLQTKKIGHLVLLKSGAGIVSEEVAEGGDYPVFGGNGLRGYFSEHTHEGNYVLIGRQGALCGNINYASGKFWASEHALVAHPLTAFETYWFGETLRAMNLNQYSVSAAQPGLAASAIAALRVPFPPSEEQSAIARFLDAKTAQIDTLLAKKRQLIDKLKERRSALIARTVTWGLPPAVAKAVGLEPNPEMRDSGVEWIGDVPSAWCVVPLKRRARFVEGPGIMAADFMDDGVPLLRISGVLGRYATLSGANYLDADLVAERWAHFKTRIGDLLISGSASTGLCSEVDEVTVGCIPYTGIIIIRALQNRACNAFLRWFFQSAQFLSQVELMKAGSTIQHFGPTHLARMTIAVPHDVAEQEAIAAFLDLATAEIDAMTATVNAAIDRLVEYRQALIISAVTGKIDVRGLA